MKIIFSLIAALAAVASARADLVMQQQITTPNYNGVTTMKIRGAKVRMDMYGGQPQALSTIVDLNTGETIALMHNQKMYLKAGNPPAGQAKSAASAPVPRPTGQTQKVGEYDTELYTWSNSRGITGTAWVAKNFPDFARIRNDIIALDKATAGSSGTTPALGSLPGMVVRSQVAGGGQTITLALISAREEPLDPSLFGIPRDYRELPKVKPAPTAAAPATPSKAPGNAAGNTRTSNSTGSAAPAKSPGNFTSQKPPAW